VVVGGVAVGDGVVLGFWGGRHFFEGVDALQLSRGEGEHFDGGRVFDVDISAACQFMQAPLSLLRTA
jgi:hypothetical protein